MPFLKFFRQPDHFPANFDQMHKKKVFCPARTFKSFSFFFKWQVHEQNDLRAERMANMDLNGLNLKNWLQTSILPKYEKIIQ